MSSSEAMDTPTLPVSPRAIGASGSYPIWVGRSNATDRPVCPCSRRNRYRFVRLDGGAEAGVLPHLQSRLRCISGWTPR